MEQSSIELIIQSTEEVVKALQYLSVWVNSILRIGSKLLQNKQLQDGASTLVAENKSLLRGINRFGSSSLSLQQAEY